MAIRSKRNTLDTPAIAQEIAGIVTDPATSEDIDSDRVSAGTIQAWGENWLVAWVASAHDEDERRNREWVAGNYRRLTLEEVVRWWREINGAEFDASTAKRAAHDHLTLYFRERIGLLVWRAYREYRSQSLPIPEGILQVFDRWAIDLEGASGHRDVAVAIEMTDGSTGAQGAAYLRKLERPRKIASDVALYLRLWGKGKPMSEAYAWVARNHHTTSENVKRIYRNWVNKDRQRRR